MLAADRLSVRFRDASQQMFEAVALARHEFRQGTFTAITGPSGSGKTTLLHALSGILPLTEGTVSWRGQAVSGMREAARDQWRRMTVGYLFQDFQLIAELSPLANVALPGTFGRHSVQKNRARLLLEEFGVSSSRARVSQLSRGEQQRVAFARALYFDPPIILADEPTASLDSENSAVVIARLLSLAKSGKVVVVVSHDAELVAASNSTLRFARGKLVAGDTP